MRGRNLFIRHGERVLRSVGIQGRCHSREGGNLITIKVDPSRCGDDNESLDGHVALRAPRHDVFFLHLARILNLSLLFLLFLVFFTNPAFASASQEKSTNRRSFILRQVLIAHETIANSKASRIIDRQIPGSIVLIDDKKYQIISFIFQDSTDSLGEETFGEYAQKNNLYSMKSEIFLPVKDTEFQVFDSAKSHIDNEVYFYISLQALKER